MLVVLDSNILLSALISPHGVPHRIYEGWREARFDLATCPEQIEELRRASRYPKFRHILQPHLVGLMLNHLHRAQVVQHKIPKKHQAADPQDADAYLLTLPLPCGRSIWSPEISAQVCCNYAGLRRHA